MAGRDEEFRRRMNAHGGEKIMGGVDLGAVAQGPPDPRLMPRTFSEVTLRASYHRWDAMLDDDGKMRAFRIVIIDPSFSNIYNYALAADSLEAEIEKLQALILVRDGLTDNDGAHLTQVFGEEDLIDADKPEINQDDDSTRLINPDATGV